MLRRLHTEQPGDFAFTPANLAWAEGQITKYPEGRQASAIIPLLWRAQEQEGWLTRPAIEQIADMLDMPYIRALEVASFYFMFQLTPTGGIAHVQICGTLSCMICGAEDLVQVCKEKIADKPHTLSADGKFTWEEVECLGACTNAPMAQIGKDYFEDLTTDGFSTMLDDLAAGKVPTPGPQNGRYAAEPKFGLTSLTEYENGKPQYNASVQLATDIGDSVKRIDGNEVPLLTPWTDQSGKRAVEESKAAKAEPVAPKVETPKAEVPKAEPVKAADPKPVSQPEAKVADAPAENPVEEAGTRPEALTAARDGGADDLKQIKGVGPKLEQLLNTLGFYHFDQIGNWSADEVSWVDQNLQGFKGRVSRDGWVDQAKVLASGGETEFSSRVKKGGVYEA